MNLDIKRATKLDLDSLFDLFTEILEEMKLYYNDRAISYMKHYHSKTWLQKVINDEEYLVFVAKEKNKLIGFQIVSIGFSIAYLEWSGVHKDYRRQKIGTKLKEFTEKYIHKNHEDIHKLMCDTRTTNIISIQNLIHNGFLINTLHKNHWFNEDYYEYEKIIR